MRRLPVACFCTCWAPSCAWDMLLVHLLPLTAVHFEHRHHPLYVTVRTAAVMRTLSSKRRITYKWAKTAGNSAR